jgi:preprotein translocase subunit SecD
MKTIRQATSLFIVLALCGCDLFQGMEEKTRVTLALDSQWAVHSELERISRDIQAYLRSNNIQYRTTGVSGGTLQFTYQGDASRDVVAMLNKQFPRLTFSDLSKANGQGKFKVGLGDASRADVLESALRHNMVVLQRLCSERGIAGETTGIGQGHIALGIPKSRYTDSLVKDLIRSQWVLFQLVADKKGNGVRVVHNKQGQPIYLKPDGRLTGEHIVNANVTRDSATGGWAVAVSLDAAGARYMGELTRTNIGRKMAAILVVDKYGSHPSERLQNAKVLTVAMIRSPFSKRFMISGLDDKKLAYDLVHHMRAGMFAAPMRIVEQTGNVPRGGKAPGTSTSAR